MRKILAFFGIGSLVSGFLLLPSCNGVAGVGTQGIMYSEPTSVQVIGTPTTDYVATNQQKIWEAEQLSMAMTYTVAEEEHQIAQTKSALELELLKVTMTEGADFKTQTATAAFESTLLSWYATQTPQYATEQALFRKVSLDQRYYDVEYQVAPWWAITELILVIGIGLLVYRFLSSMIPVWVANARKKDDLIWGVNDENEETDEAKQEPSIIEVRLKSVENGGILHEERVRFDVPADAPLTLEQLKQFVDGMSKGESLSEGHWSTDRKTFTRKAYREFRVWMLGKGWITPSSSPITGLSSSDREVRGYTLTEKGLKYIDALKTYFDEQDFEEGRQ